VAWRGDAVPEGVEDLVGMLRGLAAERRSPLPLEEVGA
jgi:hypothetical protein